MTVEQALDLAIKALKKVLGNNFSIDRIDAAYISTADKKFKRIPSSQLEKVAGGKAKKRKK
jgi:20S proteasome alpha/beta subunit